MWKRLAAMTAGAYLVAWGTTATLGRHQVLGRWREGLLTAPRLSIRTMDDGTYELLDEEGRVMSTHRVEWASPWPLTLVLRSTKQSRSFVFGSGVEERWLWLPGFTRRLSSRLLWIS